jgi:Tol biopolymer transport system component/predicted Ser/Thr protein kinase
MGTVYRATDTKLNRDVAIKVLTPKFAEDASRMQRFEREAQVLASLNHPNIAAIYGIEQGAIVMELVEGEDLHGPMSAETAIGYARQIAEALEAAHEKGIIHRDLKPANIKITRDGVVKLLDFGLAKAAESVPDGGNTQSPTMSLAMTQAGMILGTAAYMSPEQARGRPVDKRADIWAFGVILYELLTGTTLFAHYETITDIIAAVVAREPDWTALPKETPGYVRRLLERCLRKNPKQRLRDIGDVRIALEEPEADATSSESPVTKSSAARWWGVATGLFAIAAAALALIHFREAPPEAQRVRFRIPIPDGVSQVREAAIAPDGKKLVFRGNLDANSRLWLQELDSFTARPISGTERGGNFFWSPDSRSVAVSFGPQLKKIDISGGSAEILCTVATVVTGGAWSREGVILVSQPGGEGGIFRMAASGGQPVRIIGHSSDEPAPEHPQFLPDGRHFIYSQRLRSGSMEAYIGALDGKSRRLPTETTSLVEYAPPSSKGAPGHLIFVHDRNLMAQPVNESVEPAGPASVIASGFISAASSFASVSEDGVLVYRAALPSAADRTLTWFDRTGKALGKLGAPGLYNNVALSPDGRRAVVVQAGAQRTDLWVAEAARGVLTRFTFGLGSETNTNPVWSPDSGRIVFSRGPRQPFVKESHGGAPEKKLLEMEGTPSIFTSWSSDGRLLMFARVEMEKSALWVLPISGKPETYIQSPFFTSQGQFRPEQSGPPHWVAYTSDESGNRFEIFVQSYPAGAGKYRISTEGGVEPRWRGDGKELFYIAADGKLMAVEIKTSPKFGAGIPKALFDPNIYGGGAAQSVFRYDVTPDGKRFLVNSDLRSDQKTALEPFTVILNWWAGPIGAATK